MDNISVYIIEIVIVLIAYLVGRFFIPTEAGQKTVEVIEFIALWAKQFISYAAQYIDKSGSEKMDYVVSQLAELAKSNKIDVTEAQIRAIAQNAYDAVKTGESDASSTQQEK